MASRLSLTYHLKGASTYRDPVFMLPEETEQLRAKLRELTVEHQDLDDVINHLARDPGFDQIKLRRLKKRKLLLKDQIAILRSKLIPDIEA